MGDARQIILFYGHTRQFGNFSQFAPYRMRENMVDFVCAEQYHMYHKALLFGDFNVAGLILRENDPAIMKRLGRQVQNFNEEVWRANRKTIVLRGNMLKFSQHPALLDELLATGDAIIAEASPSDRIWGIGLGANHPDARDPKKWRGENLLGKTLMHIRNAYRQFA